MIGQGEWISDLLDERIDQCFRPIDLSVLHWPNRAITRGEVQGQTTPSACASTVSRPGMTSIAMSQATPIVFVVDDDLSIRESLEDLIRFEGWHPVTFDSAQDFLAHPRVFVPNCLVLDVLLPDLNGLDLQNRIALERHDMPIIFISGCSDVRLTARAMKAGAWEFLTKPVDDDVLLAAIRAALERSGIALSWEMEIETLRDCYASLSGRERQVMTLVVSGLSNRHVGNELGITQSTVKAHRGKVMKKMKAKSIPDLVRMAGRLASRALGHELLYEPASDSEYFE